jgi:hypothetical protein
LTFKINSSLKHDNRLTCLVPFAFNEKKIEAVAIDGKENSYAVKSMKGFEYAWIMISPGSNYRVEINYR